MEGAVRAPIEEVEPFEAGQEIEAGDVVLIDVREPWEHRLERIDGAQLIPLGELFEHPDAPEIADGAAGQLDGPDDVILLCQAGVRSAQALNRLREADIVA